ALRASATLRLCDQRIRSPPCRTVAPSAATTPDLAVSRRPLREIAVPCRTVAPSAATAPDLAVPRHPLREIAVPCRTVDEKPPRCYVGRSRTGPFGSRCESG